MVVILIMGVLAAAGFANYVQLQRTKTVEEELRKLKSVIILASQKAASADASICTGSSDINIRVKLYRLQINSNSYTITADCENTTNGTAIPPNPINYKIKSGALQVVSGPNQLRFEINTGKILNNNATSGCYKLTYQGKTKFLKIKNVYAEASIQNNCS